MQTGGVDDVQLLTRDPGQVTRAHLFALLALAPVAALWTRGSLSQVPLAAPVTQTLTKQKLSVVDAHSLMVTQSLCHSMIPNTKHCATDAAPAAALPLSTFVALTPGSRGRS